MQPLLKIKSIPIKIESQSRRASLKYNSANGADMPTVNVSRQKGGMRVQSTLARVNIDQSAARANIGLKTVTRLTQDFAQKGKVAAQEASQNFSRLGQAVVDAHGKGTPIADVISSQAMEPMATAGPEFGPPVAPEFEVDTGSLSFDYQMDKLTFDWNVSTKPQLEYVPPSLEFSVTQYPEVIIEYLGDPIYVPARSNPDYQASGLGKA